MQGNGNNPTEKGTQSTCPTFRIVFNPTSYQCVIEASVPNLEFGRYMLTIAMEQVEKQIAERDKPKIALAESVPPPSLFTGR